MRRFLVSFHNSEGVNVAYLIFAAADATTAFAVGSAVLQDGSLDLLEPMEGFEVEGLAPRPIDESELGEFIARIESERRAREAEEGGT